jgi:FtsX-like permease family
MVGRLQAGLLLLAVTAATTVLTLGLALHGVTGQPYQQTRAATDGPDVVAQMGGQGAAPGQPGRTDQAQVAAQARTLIRAPGVTASSGPFPVASAVVRVRGLTAGAEVEGRGQGQAVLAGSQLAERGRRVGLLKAVGSSPGLVAVVLLAENLVLALLAAAAGLAAGWLCAPLVTIPGAALVGAPGPPALTLPVASEVVAVALVVALAATLGPAIRAARTSTVRALADPARSPTRQGALIAISARLPVPLLIGLRLVGRRPRRALLSAASVAVTVTGIVAVLAFHTSVGLKRFGGANGLRNPVADRDAQILLVLTVVLLTLAIVNAVCATWATVLDTRRASALSRALGATPRQVSAGLSAAQVIPGRGGRADQHPGPGRGPASGG